MTKTHEPFPLDRIEAIEADIALLSEYRNSRTQLMELAAEMHNISMSDLRGPSRVAELSHKRWRLFYLLRRMGLSYGRIGHLVNRDHSTVLYGVRRVEASLKALQSGHKLPVCRKNKYTPRPNVPVSPFVSWNGRDGRWLVRITQNRKRKCFGCFYDFDIAIATRDAALRTHVEAA